MGRLGGWLLLLTAPVWFPVVLVVSAVVVASGALWAVWAPTDEAPADVPPWHDLHTG